MMRDFLLGWSVMMFFVAPLSAQIRKFPYEGLVEADGAYARSGPGNQFYPTSRLDRGTKILVHRHDPGGWYMIAPPKGSFSWVRAEYVKKTSANRGLVTENNVIVRVGSGFDEETREVEQVRLSKNDQVEILEEKTLSTPTGPIPHLKIVPPTGEYRWVSGKYVTAVDQIVRTQQDKNPFDTPSQLKQPTPVDANNIAQNPPGIEPGPGGLESTLNKPTGDEAIRHTGPDPAVLLLQRQRLEELDVKFREMVNGRTQDWSFAPLEQGYRQLQEEAALPALAGQIDLRMAAINRYQKIKTEYDALMRLTADTRERDAQLMSMPGKQPVPIPRPQENEPLTPEPDPFAQQQGPVPDPVELPGVEPLDVNPGTAQPQSRPAPAAMTPQAPPKFDGAGIVQRAAAAGTGTPSYVLITPKGRVLAYLQPTSGLNLEPYVGKSMGIYGQRTYRPDLRTDLIVVRSLTPVRLAP
jgi:hypothetical protein